MNVRLTPEVTAQFSMMIFMNNLWVTSEAVELAKRHGGQYAGEVPTPFENLGFDTYEEYFAYEFKEPNHKHSAEMAQARRGRVDLDVYNRWLFEEQNEPEHRHLAKYM